MADDIPQAASDDESSIEFEVYDFNTPSRIPEEQAKTIQMIHETFAETASLRLSAYLGSEINISLDNVEQVSFEEYLSSLSSPTCIAVLDMHPLSGYSVVEVNSVIVYSIINKMLGGEGQDDEIKRPFTDLELSISKKFFKVLLQELSNAWASILTITFSVKAFQTNPMGVRSIPTREACLVVTLKMTIGEKKGLTTIAIPYVSLEPISGKLRNEQWNNRFHAKQPEEISTAHQRNFNAMEMEVSAILGTLPLSIEEVLLLQKGDILDLEQKVHDPIELRVGNTAKFMATPGLVAKYKGVIIKEEVCNG